MVIFKTREEELYFNWLCDRVETPVGYSRLMETLYTTPFFYRIELDQNRVKDALILQQDYIYECGLNSDVDYQLHNLNDMSVLEVLIAMAVKIEVNVMQDDDYGDRTAKWFWLMLYNLEIDSETDNVFNEDRVLWALARFMNREFEYDGTGSIVALSHCETDAREIQLWHLFCLYLTDLLERGII